MPVPRIVLALIAALLAAPVAAQVNPFTALGRAISTTLDVRTKEEVAADAEIGAGASSRLLEDKRAEWAGVSILVFQEHVVLAGAVKNAEAKRIVEQVVRKDRRIRSLHNELRTDDAGSLVRDTALEAEINGSLTSASGVSSVNMRWSAVGGHVVLLGVAQSKAEADRAVERIRDISAVKSVKSRLRIVPPAQKKK